MRNFWGGRGRCRIVREEKQTAPSSLRPRKAVHETSEQGSARAKEKEEMVDALHSRGGCLPRRETSHELGGRRSNGGGSGTTRIKRPHHNLTDNEIFR